MKRNLIAGLALGVAATACSNDDEVVGSSLASGVGDGRLEALLGYEAKDDALIIRVKSNGCTDKRSFRVNASADAADASDSVYRVSLSRVRPDYCKAFLPEGEVLTWTLEELAIPLDAAIQVDSKVIVARPEALDQPACRPEICDPA
jgi:hypothetical protein